MGFHKTFWLILVLVLLSVCSHAQLWSGILKPTSGTGACTYRSVNVAGQCAIDWTASGIPGGIPSGTWTQSGSTIAATGGDQRSQIQTAINNCANNGPTGKYVQLGSGTFNISGTLSLKNYCVLRGNGTQNTILNYTSAVPAIAAGALGDAPYRDSNAIVISGATAGSSSMVIHGDAVKADGKTANGNTSIGAGGYMMITELNDPVYVDIRSIIDPNSGAYQSCTYCDNSMYGGARVRGQVIEVTSVSQPKGPGTPITIQFAPPLYTDYGTASGTGPALATSFGVLNNGAPDAKWTGVEDLQIAMPNGDMGNGNIEYTECAYCWVKNVESNYTPGDHLRLLFSFRNEVRDSYFHNAYRHGAGSADASLLIAAKTTASLIENNILERMHSPFVFNWGAAGNVVAYNYAVSSFDNAGYNTNQIDFAFHGAHPQFNLFEGNVGANFQPDSWHGTTAYNTTFRNWWTAVTYVVPGNGLAGCPNAGNYDVDACYVQGRYPIDWVHGHNTHQQARAIPIAYLNLSHNFVADALGSDAASSIASGHEYNGGSGPCTSCALAPTTRPYSTSDTPPTSSFFAFTFGYTVGSDTAGVGVSSMPGGPSNTAGYWLGLSYATTFIHGSYDMASASTTWDVHGSGSHTLPASFYRTSKPSWFGNVPWPAIGPDVTGGPDNATGGHANYIPAQVCYNNTARDSNGIKIFDPVACYGGQQPPPDPPSSLTATAH